MERTVFLTGISGFIGKEIAMELLRRGYIVNGSIRSSEEAETLRALFYENLDTDALNLKFHILDMLQPQGWSDAMAGCSKVIHTASPVPAVMPKSENELIVPAVQGTLNVLQAALAVSIDHVVMTSSVTAINEGHEGSNNTTFSEEDWSQINASGVSAYTKSKTLSEKAAWDFVHDNSDTCFALTTLLPGVTIGPIHTHVIPTSISLISRLYDRFDLMLPNFGYPYIDVRDVARCHVDALERKATRGERIALNNGFLWYPQIADIIDRHFPEIGVVKRKAPSWFIRAAARYKRRLQPLVGILDRQADVSTAKAKAIFGHDFIPLEVSLVETIKSIRLQRAKRKTRP